MTHIWRRLGFGPTRKDVVDGKAMGTAALIDALFAKPSVGWAQSASPSDSAGQSANAGRQLELMAFGPVAQILRAVTGCSPAGRPGGAGWGR